MLTLCLSPWLVSGGLAASLITGGILALVFLDKGKVEAEHDAEREIQRLTQKVRHPWRFRFDRWITK